MASKSKPKLQESRSWWATIPGLLTALGGFIAAVAALLTALKAAGLLGPSVISAAASAPSSPVAIVTSPGRDPIPGPEEATMSGTTGWIYVGTRVGGQWQKTKEEGMEPAKTLRLDGLPVRGMTYGVEHGVNIRESLPKAATPGERPPMPNSRGAIDTSYKVKVDDVQEILLINPTRVWVWAHVTVAARE